MRAGSGAALGPGMGVSVPGPSSSSAIDQRPAVEGCRQLYSGCASIRAAHPPVRFAKPHTAGERESGTWDQAAAALARARRRRARCSCALRELSGDAADLTRVPSLHDAGTSGRVRWHRRRLHVGGVIQAYRSASAPSSRRPPDTRAARARRWIRQRPTARAAARARGSRARRDGTLSFGRCRVGGPVVGDEGK
jgi:hypothetical protein